MDRMYLEFVPVDENEHVRIVHPRNLHWNLILQPDLVDLLVLLLVQEERVASFESLVRLSIFIEIRSGEESSTSHLAVENHKALSHPQEDARVRSAMSCMRDAATTFLPIDNSLTAGALAAHHHTTDEAKCWTFHLPGRGSADIVGAGELRGEVHQVGVVAGQRDQTSSHGRFLVSKAGEREVRG